MHALRNDGSDHVCPFCGERWPYEDYKQYNRHTRVPCEGIASVLEKMDLSLKMNSVEALSLNPDRSTS